MFDVLIASLQSQLEHYDPVLLQQIVVVTVFHNLLYPTLLTHGHARQLLQDTKTEMNASITKLPFIPFSSSSYCRHRDLEKRDFKCHP